ncbi:hypothetical protein AVEN_212108-1 [Araneus ventricosus]|uniref:Uncharacterized protein n=1 Tax=Araneus ventricosus TaxID=182803 RepID=A0A4Y2RDN5_ARAVE|nr:hypothetical protein AVEN_212108-1 [Araneus ventricosus]
MKLSPSQFVDKRAIFTRWADMAFWCTCRMGKAQNFHFSQTNSGVSFVCEIDWFNELIVRKQKEQTTSRRPMRMDSQCAVGLIAEGFLACRSVGIIIL